MVTQLRDWLKRAKRAGGRASPPWTDAEVAAVRQSLKEGRGFADIATALRRSPEDVARKISEFQPGRLLVREGRGREVARSAD